MFSRPSPPLLSDFNVDDILYRAAWAQTSPKDI